MVQNKTLLERIQNGIIYCGFAICSSGILAETVGSFEVPDRVYKTASLAILGLSLAITKKALDIYHSQ